jgi:hypothetical protein
LDGSGTAFVATDDDMADDDTITPDGGTDIRELAEGKISGGVTAGMT